VAQTFSSLALLLGFPSTDARGAIFFQASTILAGDRRTQGEPFASGAVEEQTTLIEHLLSLKPLQGVAQKCAMFILNTQHVQTPTD